MNVYNELQDGTISSRVEFAPPIKRAARYKPKTSANSPNLALSDSASLNECFESDLCICEYYNIVPHWLNRACIGLSCSIC